MPSRSVHMPRTAWNWRKRSGRSKAARKMWNGWNASHWSMTTSGRASSGSRKLERRTGGGALERRAFARSLSNLANTVKLQGDNARARALYAECLSIFRELGDRTGVAWSTNYQGDVARDQGDSGGARILYEQCLEMFRELGDRWGIAGTLADLGSLSREEGDDATARSQYRESIRLFQELDHKRGIARLLERFACS